MTEQYSIKKSVLDSLDRYVNDKIPTGGFLEAVLCNNLMEAVGRADDDNLRNLYTICMYVRWEIPHNCHGSPEKVRAWLGVEEK